MTDTATKELTDGVGDASAGTPEVQWAPAEPAPKKRRLWLWIGVPAGLIACGAAAAGLLLIAPGTTVAGVPVGFMTPGAAAEAVDAGLAGMTVSIKGGKSVTGAELGASVDATAITAETFEERPLWNVTQWFGDPEPAEVTLDPAKADAALRQAAPSLYTDATPAALTFDGTSYVVTPAVPGQGIDLDALTANVQSAFDAGDAAVTVTPKAALADSTITTEKATATAGILNTMLDSVGFYVGDERTVPVARDVAASWLTVTTDDAGDFKIAADAAAIQPVVDTLAPLVNRGAQNGAVVTNSSGEVLETITQGLDGRTLGDTAGVANAFAEQLAGGNSAYQLPVTSVAPVTTSLHREIEVDLSAQVLYMKENGAVVDSWYISSGRPGPSATAAGHFTVNWHVRSQTMTGTALDSGVSYDVPNVEWVMYFNGDQAFHGVYWHSDFGTPHSNGCVGMPNWRAEQLYDWTANGVEVWTHY
ncbi:L,D-transpeptidase family protein [Microbacterium sp.]|uniref:L,D-transpeptidase family protein n=1 Tax=Microbacterium sp. TaxID=51671 RepID=UPI0039E70A2C